MNAENDTPEVAVNSLREELLHLTAEFDNYRKQVARERETWREKTLDEATLMFLPVYEALERALREDQDPEQFREGVAAAFRLFEEIMGRLGCKPIEAAGQEFDPLYHEAVAAEEAEAPKNMILEEFQKGWTRNGRVLRPAKVKVSLGKGGENHGG